MRVLALDTALDACSAALIDTAGEGRLLAAETLPLVRGHAEALVPLMARVRAAAGHPVIDRVAVTVGPGSFTGLRVGLAAARGYGLVAGVPVVGVTTLAALAAPLLADDDGSAVLAAIDARHGAVYAQLFGPGGVSLWSARQAPVADAARAAATTARVRLIGSGAAPVAAAWPVGAALPAAVVPVPAPEIAWVARLGAAADPQAMPPRPLYLRGADAKPQDGFRIARA